MKFYYYSPSETFIVLTADQFVGRDDGLLEQQRQDIHVCRKNCTLSLIFRKNQSPHYKGDEEVNPRQCVVQRQCVQSFSMVCGRMLKLDFFSVFHYLNLFFSGDSWIRISL